MVVSHGTLMHHESARLMQQPPFGAAVWGGDYVILPAAKLYKPIWTYDRKTLANDLSAHLVYGLATATALQVLSRKESSCH